MQHIPILFQDDDLIVVDKPAGLLAVPAPGRTKPALGDVLTAQLGRRALAVHRLDEETSGAMVFALADAARAGLERLFAAHEAERIYLALASAAPSPPAGRIEAQLREDGGIVRVVRTGGEPAVTHYETIERRGRCTLVRCRLETGRRNQIRVHFQALGCSLAGDRKYGYRARPGESFRRVMLHSWRIAFRHPLRDAAIDVTCEPPEPELRP